MSKPLCIYHGNCADGFGAAWVVRKFFGEGVDFHAGFYGQEAPDVTNRTVVMVDFSYKRAVLDAMAAKAAGIIILDHHKTAQEDLAPFAVTECGSGRFCWEDTNGMFRDCAEIDRPPVLALFDMKRSGAMLAWDYFFPRELPPTLLKHIQDRDLWLFKLAGTREIQASLFSYPYDFEVWDKLMEGRNTESLRVEGRAIERKHHKDIGELVGASKRRMVIGGFDVPVANLPYTLSSDAGHMMANGEPFAACYMDTPNGRVFSLRSSDEGEDVSAVAKSYGGGGHRNASGFQRPIGWEGD